MIVEIHGNRCPPGWIATEEGGCTDDNECISMPCNNGGICINLDNGQGFLCDCKAGFAGEVCHLPVQEKIILVASGTYWVIAFVLINVVGKISVYRPVKFLNTLRLFEKHLFCSQQKQIHFTLASILHPLFKKLLVSSPQLNHVT